MLNVFNRATQTGIVTTIATSATSSAFAPFNPFTDTPKECPQFQADGVTGTTNAQCTALGANYRKAVNFGAPSSNTAFQTPRLWRFSAGIRF